MKETLAHSDSAPGIDHAGPIPMPCPVKPGPALRVIGGTLAVFVSFLAVIVVVRSAGGSTLGRALAVVLGLIVVPIVASPLEWLVHRYVYHEAVVRPLAAIFKVHTAHHFTFFPTWRYVTGGPARRLAIRSRAPGALTNPWRNGVIRLAHFIWYMSIGLVAIWTPGYLLTHNGWFMVGIIVSSAIVSNLFIVVHDTIHRPRSHRLVEVQPWFGFLDRHHYIHHVDLGANLNFLLPLGDVIFGTLRTTLSTDELARHGDLARAKSVPRGRGERAHRAP